MGLFGWEATTISGLESKKNIELKKEQEVMVVYPLKLLFELSLDPSRNISSNPGRRFRSTEVMMVLVLRFLMRLVEA